MRKCSVCLMLFTLLILCVNAQEKEQAGGTKVDIRVIDTNTLAMQLYKGVAKDQDNLVISPYSVAVTLGMSYMGSEDLTQAQMARILHFQLNKELVAESFGFLASSFATKPSKSKDDLSLNIANSMWVQIGQPLVKQFADAIVNDYKGVIKQVDFVNRSTQAEIEINQWARDKTQGKITELFKHGEISRDDRILLISAINMKGKWQQTFDPKFTKHTPFFPFPEKTMTVPMMTLISSFPFLKEKEFSLVELPYDSGTSESVKLSMIILLPHETYGLKNIEAKLNANIFADWLRSMKRTKMIITIPKFNVESATTYKETLMSIGLIDPFTNNADFSGIDGTRNLKLSKIVQKAFIKIDEKGTEAGAATSASISVKSSMDVEPREIFLVDHPFMFFIVDKAKGAILFMGRVSLPGS